MLGPISFWLGLLFWLTCFTSIIAEDQVEEFVCGVADLQEDADSNVKPFTCDNIGGPAQIQPEKPKIPADKFPWIGIISSSLSKQKICLGVVISQDLVVASEPCEVSGQYTFEIGQLNFKSDLSAVKPKHGDNSENNILVMKLDTKLPPSIYRPACVPEQHFVAKSVKATDSCGEKTNTLLKVSLKGGNIVSSTSRIVTETDCANNILLNKNSDCWVDFDHGNHPCMTIDQTKQKKGKYTYQNYKDYTCHRGILQSIQKCELDEVVGESKCNGIDEDSCIGNLPYNDKGELHKCRKEIAKYSKCITDNIINVTNDYSDFPFNGVNCLHSYLPNRPVCAKHKEKHGLPSLGTRWGFDPKKAFRRDVKKCKKSIGRWGSKRACEMNMTAQYAWMHHKPYEGKWSISMVKEMMEVNKCIVNATKCNVCNNIGGSVCIDEQLESKETEFLFWYESCRDRWFFLGPSTFEKRKKICSKSEITEIPFLEQNTKLIQDYARDHSSRKITILPLYPRPVIIMLGNTGVGKSTVANSLLMGHAGNKQCFATSSGASSKTKMTKWSKGKWLGVGKCVTVIDTPGTQDTGGKKSDYQNVMNIMNILKDEVKQIDVFMVLFNGQYPRFDQGIQAALNTYEALFGETFWDHVVTEFSFWKYAKTDLSDRYNSHCKELKEKCLENDVIDDAPICNGEVCPIEVECSGDDCPECSGDDCPECSGDECGEDGSGDEASGDDDGNEHVVGLGSKRRLGRKKRSLDNQDPHCKLMLESERSFSNPSAAEISFYKSETNDNFWDTHCGWRSLPKEKAYPAGWDQESKNIYNKADFITRFIKTDRWNIQYHDKMKVLKSIPSVFVNPLWSDNKLACERFQRETDKLWNTIQTFEPYSCTAKCEAPESYFIGKPHIFGPDTIYIEETPTTPGSPLHCSIWTGVDGASDSDVEWYRSNNKQLQISSDMYDVEILEDNRKLSSRRGGVNKHQTAQLIINSAKLASGDAGLYYCLLNGYPHGKIPAIQEGKVVTEDQITKAQTSRENITVNCDILEISKIQMEKKLLDVQWYFAKKLLSRRSDYDMSLDTEAKHDQFSIQKLTFDRMDESFEGNYTCKISGQFSDEVKVNMNVDATWSHWGSESTCSVSCGDGGHKTAKRTCKPPRNKGLSCDALKAKALKDGHYAYIKKTSCEYKCCPVHGEWGKWQEWSKCSEDCYNTMLPQPKHGEKNRKRECTEPSPQCGGQECPGKTQEVSKCNDFNCPIHGHWTEWSSWSNCIKDPNVECSGTLERTRSCTNPRAQYGGRQCLNVGRQTQNCDPKCAIDCKATSWGLWSECSATCGKGHKNRQRGSIPAINNGKSCKQLGIQLKEVEPCIVKENCPIDGVWDDWASWGHCNSVSGIKRRERSCYFENSGMQTKFNAVNAFGGHGCSGKPSEDTNCPVNCICNAEWEKWDSCSAKCFKPGNKLKRKRRRTCIPAKNNGKECTDKDTTEESFCLIPRCGYIIDGVWGDWGKLSKCPVECGGGEQQQKRTCGHPRKDLLIANNDYDPKKDKLLPCPGKGIQKKKEKCHTKSCNIQSLIFVMDTSCSFDGTDQDTAKELASKLMELLIKEEIDVPRYQLISSPGQSGNWPPQVLPSTTLSATFTVQYSTDALQRGLCGGQWNLKTINLALEKYAKDGDVLVLFTDTGTSETDSDQLTEDVLKKAADKKATIIIFITPHYTGNLKSMEQYRKISENRVYEMNKHKAKDVISVVKRKLQKIGGGNRCIGAGGPMWPIERYECQFPFKYEGKEYDKCTTTDHVQSWCSTFVDSDLLHQDGKVGLCGDCSGLIDPVCSNYKVLKDASRDLLAGKGTVNDYSNTWSGFYRFESPAGIKLPENLNDVGNTNACIQGGHPKVMDKIQRKKVCWGKKCAHSTQIRTITCPSNRGEEFHLYELEKPPKPGYTYAAVQGECPTNWVAIRTNEGQVATCFFTSTDKLSWENAKLGCKSMGGDLFEPQSEDMNQKVWKYIKLSENMNVTRHYWLGFNDIDKEGDISSAISAQAISLYDFPWLAGSPRDDHSLNCLNVITKNGRFTDSACQTELHYICQRTTNV